MFIYFGIFYYFGHESNYTTTGLDNELSPVRHQAIIWTKLKVNMSLGNIFQWNMIRNIISINKMHLKMLSAKCWLFCRNLNMFKGFLKVQCWALDCHVSQHFMHPSAGIILYMHPANERRCYIVTSSLIGWVHTQNDPCSVPRHCAITQEQSLLCYIL